MLTPLLYPYIKFALGTLYPAYKTWKALKRKDITTRNVLFPIVTTKCQHHQRRWMKYWVSFAAFQMFELVADIILALIMPFYIEIKMAFIMWLVLGSNLIYDSIVDRELVKREKSIDKWLKRVGKLRDELIALIWFEISRSSVKIITSIFSGSLSVLVKDVPDQNMNDEERLEHDEGEENNERKSNQASLEYEVMEVDIDID